jgi:phosphatidylglycerophosphate synthase
MDTFARRRGQVTRLGQLLDPIADKLLISAALISLVENQLAPAWAVVIHHWARVCSDGSQIYRSG